MSDIFISYAREERNIAISLESALRAEGHSIFLADTVIKPAENFNRWIRDAIRASDIFVFLISPAAVQPGSYTLTELRFAQEKWSNPTHRVLPVMAVDTPIENVPSYAKAVSILIPSGNLDAEVCDAVYRICPDMLRRIWILTRHFGALLLTLAILLLLAIVFSNNAYPPKINEG